MQINELLRIAGLAAAFVTCVMPASGQSQRFEKVSLHCHALAGTEGSPNVGAVVTAGGALLVNPPGGESGDALLDALKKLGPAPVRWAVYTDLGRELAGSPALFSKQDILMLSSADSDAARKSLAPGGGSPLRLVFERQLRLFPENLEIRVFAPARKWHQGGDIAVFVPAEKVLMVGDIYSPGSLPDLESETADASPLAWLEALKQVIETVPLLKSAMPQPKTAPEKPGEAPKTLEELVIAIPAVGQRSNLMEMKDLLATAQKLRAEVARAVSQGRPRASFLDSPAFGPFRSLANLESFAGRLYGELQRR